MQDNIFQDKETAENPLSSQAKKDCLESLARTWEDSEYQRPLTQEELEADKDLLAQTMIKLGHEDVLLQKFKTEMKGRTKPLELQKNETLQRIKTGQVEEVGPIYTIDDHETGMVGVYDQHGYLISSRRMKATERQRGIFGGLAAGYTVKVDTEKDGTNG